METLNQFLLNELKAALIEHYNQIEFPFENTIDYLNNNMSNNLTITIQILECIDFIYETFNKNNKK